MTVRKLASAFAIGAAMTVLTVSPAAAGHCADNGGPGNSDFGAHVQEHEGSEGGHSGWASCEETAQEENSARRATPQS